MKIMTIKAISRASVKIRDSFYTVEYGEERSIEEGDDIKIEREKLWDTCNNEIDNQLEDIIKSFK
ncbi:hypothetical protein J6O48_11450 [bacterium]|nr:hypothetical protein [bacterium]